VATNQFAAMSTFCTKNIRRRDDTETSRHMTLFDVIKRSVQMMKSVDRHLYGGGEMDFLASSIALMEWQGREVDAGKVAGNMSESQSRLFFERLSYFRQLYQAAATVEHSV
jgi:hypothetical protein